MSSPGRAREGACEEIAQSAHSRAPSRACPTWSSKRRPKSGKTDFGSENPDFAKLHGLSMGKGWVPASPLEYAHIFEGRACGRLQGTQGPPSLSPHGERWAEGGRGVP